MRVSQRLNAIIPAALLLPFAAGGARSARAADAECNLLSNGGFERAGRLSAKRLEAQTKAGLKFDTQDPLLPVGWRWDPGGAVGVALAADARFGERALRVACPEASVGLEPAMIEVVPGATYAFGGWARGAGNARMVVHGNAYEGRREIAGVDLALGRDWAEARGKVTIPGNIRTVSVAVGVWRSAEVLLDGLRFSGVLAAPFDIEAAETTRFTADEHTLVLVDFDGQGEYRLEGGAKLTGPDGGRFGRGARVSEPDVSSAVIPLTRGEMPPEGTLEFWFSPDDDPKHPTQYMTVLAAARDVLFLDTHETLRVRWRVGDDYESTNNIMWGDPNARRVWIRKGEWHHVAVQWDGEAVRLFVDGGLAGVSAARPLPFYKTPSAIQLGGMHIVNAWSGVVDEVRLSDIRRYGPVVPVGATWRPFPVPAAAAERPAARPASRPAPDFAKERKALIGSLPPPPPGAVAFDASQVRPLVADDPDFAIQADTPVPGMTVARIGTPGVELIRVPDNDGGYWRLAGVPAGAYYVGVWYESSAQGLEAPQRYRGAVMLYLNGRALQLSTHSDPVQLAPGRYYAEAQSAARERLSDGDEIAVLTEVNQPVHLARLTLYPKEPPRGRGWMYENYGANMFSRDTALRLNAFCGFLFAPGKGFRKRTLGMDLVTDSPECLKRAADGRALAYYRVANPLSVPLTVKCRAEVKAYFRELVGSEETTIRLGAHERVTREVPFTVIPDSRRYSVDVKVSAVGPPPLGWPVADTISFFRGVRQRVPWPDPFANEFRRGLEFAAPLSGVRQRVSLDGWWESAVTPVPTAPPVPPPEGLKWERRQVPFHPWLGNLDPKPHAMYLRRKVTLPEGAGARTWRLLVAEIVDEATAYVNGRKVGNVRGCNTPLLCDVTSALREGENEILLVVRDGLANMDPAYVNPADPVVSPQYLDAPGVGYGFTFAVAEARLESSPLVTAEDLHVETSVRKKAITARFNVTNREAAPRRLKVKASVLDAGAPVMGVGESAVTVEAGRSEPVRFMSKWESPVLWGPGSPKLYTLAVEVADAATGERLDLLRERFGFRESWIQGNRIMLNGAPVRLKGSNCGGGGGLVGSDDVQWTRGSDGVEDYLDEAGCLAGLYILGGLGNTPSRHNVGRDVYWEIETRNVLAGAAQFVNHPCIIAWDLSNEWLSFLSYGGGDPLAGARRFKAVGDALAAYDPTRWILFDGDRDLHGLWNTFSEHYMGPYGGGYDMHGHSACLPDSRFWRPLDRDFEPGKPVRASAYHSKTFYRPDEQVILDTENAWKVDGLQPPGMTAVIGEDDVLSPAIDSGRGPMAWYWKQNVDGHRDLGVSIVCNYTTVTGLNRRGHMLQCFIMPEHAHHYFAGRTIERRYSLHNDLLVPSGFTFRWKLVDPSGRAVARGEERKRMESGGMHRGLLSLRLPGARRRTVFTLCLELLADGRFAYGEERDIEVWPDAPPPIAPPARRIALYDPAGTTAPVLRKAGVRFTTMGALAAPAGRPADSLLVIGEGALEGDIPSAAALTAFAAEGGRLLVLMQEKLLPGLPIQTVLEPREWASMLFVRTPQHPALEGIGSWDLHFWVPDHVVARGSYSRPAGGSFVALVDGSGDHDRAGRSAMEWTQLLECWRGRGSYLLCQLPLVEKYDGEPMAREMLARLVAYSAGRAPFRSPAKTLLLAGDPASPAAARLRDLGVSFRMIEAEAAPAEGEVLVVDAGALAAGFAPPPAWRKALKGGATIVVHGAAPEREPLLEALAGRPVRVTVQPYATWEGRGYRNGFTWLTPGLSHVDLYWKKYDGWEGAVAQAEQPKYKIEDLCHWSVRAEGAVEHVFPGALVEVPVGRGRLVVDQIRWETSNKELDRSAARVVSAMMAGLDVATAPYVPPRDLPPDIVYRPVDLSAFANRGLRDEVGDDGRGGWADQGPKADLREFPTGRRDFGGVPFAVGEEPRTCVVLRSARRPFPELVPAEVTIPLGFPVEGLCFLHTATWLGGNERGAAYQIQYADGTTHEIALAEGENIRDWTAAPAEFARERGTRSRVAWTGTTELFPVVCVFRMLWVNPQPDAPVRAVRYSNPGANDCPILMGLTAAVRPGEADRETAAAAKARAAEWLRKGAAAADAGRDAEAREALREAVKEDPGLDAAHQRLCELAEKARDEDATLAAYSAWAAAGARTPLPYNKIGEIQERRGNERAAFEAYSKSLEIEWNQPPIIQAKTRLMLKLKTP